MALFAVVCMNPVAVASSGLCESVCMGVVVPLGATFSVKINGSFFALLSCK